VANGPPLRLRVDTRNPTAMFDTRGEPSFPHTHRLVDARLAAYLENHVRESPRTRPVELEVGLRETSPGPSEEEDARRDLHAFFRAEREVVELELRVNQREGWGFLRRTFPLLIVALAIAGVFYISGPGVPSGAVGELVTALFYLLFITIVWVLLWDPIEKLLFDAFLLRARIHALQKLGDADVRFVSASGPSDRPSPVP